MKSRVKLVERVADIAASVESWADLYNALYNADDGLLTTVYPTPAERREFMKTREYRQIKEIQHKTIERFGLVAGATPRKSGKFVVRLPQSLHAALEREAEYEGVSLNQLVVAKLSAQLSVLTAPKRRPASA